MTRSKRKTRAPIRFCREDNDGGEKKKNTLVVKGDTHKHPSGGISVGDIGFTLKKKFDKVLYTGTVVRICTGAGKMKSS
jgi:hypothetical protein